MGGDADSLFVALYDFHGVGEEQLSLRKGYSLMVYHFFVYYSFSLFLEEARLLNFSVRENEIARLYVNNHVFQKYW